MDPINDLGTTIAGATGVISFTILESGSPLVPTNLWVTIYDEESGTSILTKTALSPVGTYVNGSGVLTYQVALSHSGLVSTDLEPKAEFHRFLFEWDWLSGARVGKWLGRIRVEPDTKQPDDD